jgi:hypothetical protein
MWKWLARLLGKVEPEAMINVLDQATQMAPTPPSPPPPPLAPPPQPQMQPTPQTPIVPPYRKKK